MPPARPYRAFLTAALHRRFVEAAGATLLCCFVAQIFLNGKTCEPPTLLKVFAPGLLTADEALWSFIPLGPAGIRSLGLFFCMLIVLYTRVSNLRASRYNFESDAHKIVYALLRYDTYVTLVVYISSALMFAEFFIWMQPPKFNLSMIDPGRLHERARLNERPILLRCLYLLLAIGQTVWHFHWDVNHIRVPVSKRNSAKPGDPPRAIITEIFAGNNWKNSFKILEKSALFGIFTVPLAVVVYWSTGMRQLAWHITLSVAHVYNHSAFNSKLSAIPPFFGDVLFHFILAATCLGALWEVTNRGFTLAVARAPLKSKTGETLSQQPDMAKSNATLVSGLRSKRDLVKTNAFWELVLISRHVPQRRAAIFQDINQPEGSTWSQIFTIALAELHAIVIRIQDATGAKVAPPAPAAVVINDALTVPRNLPGLKTDPQIFENPAPPKTAYSQAGRGFTNFAKSIGNSPGSMDPISPRAKKLLEQGASAILPCDQQALLNSGGLVAFVQFWAKPILTYPVGSVFRCTFARRVSSVILGSPLANASVIVDAIDSLTQFALCATTEDKFGLVFKDVATLIRTYASTLEKIQGFLIKLEPHWTDVYHEQTKKKLSKDGDSDVELIIGALQNGLKKLIAEFGGYIDELDISRGELRKAKEVCGYEQ